MTKEPGAVVVRVDFSGWPTSQHGYDLAMRAAGRSPGTIRLHRHYLGLLAAQHRHPWRITGTQLVAFMARESWGPSARKSARTVVCGFYRWGHAQGHVETDPAATLPTVRVPAGVPRPAPERVVLSLVDGTHRTAFMAQLAAYAGLRAAEIARVHARDYSPGEVGAGALHVTGKGGRTRTVPIIGDPLASRLDQLEGWAFPNGLGGHLSPAHVSRLMSATMPDGWTCHTLRHRFGTRAYAGTRDLLAVQQLLGHSRPETTQRYVLLPDGAMRAAVLSAAS